MKTEQLGDYALTYDDSPEAKERIFTIALAAFKKLRHFSGESLAQSDNTYVEAPNILSELAEDGFRFEQEWKD